jgi:hypothetical protein
VIRGFFARPKVSGRVCLFSVCVTHVGSAAAAAAAVTQELDVSRSPCTASGLGGIAGLTASLRVLNLRGCQVGKEDAEGLDSVKIWSNICRTMAWILGHEPWLGAGLFVSVICPG